MGHPSDATWPSWGTQRGGATRPIPGAVSTGVTAIEQQVFVRKGLICRHSRLISRFARTGALVSRNGTARNAADKQPGLTTCVCQGGVKTHGTIVGRIYDLSSAVSSGRLSSGDTPLAHEPATGRRVIGKLRCDTVLSICRDRQPNETQGAEPIGRGRIPSDFVPRGSGDNLQLTGSTNASVVKER